MAWASPLAAQTRGAAGTARAPGENPDAALVSGAARHGIAEAELSDLAARAASSPSLRDFAASMARARDVSNRKLAMIAAHENIDLPGTLDAEDSGTYHELQRLAGPEFDRAYIDAMVADQDRMVSLLESGQATVSTEELRTYIRITLPHVRRDLDRTQALQR